MRGPQRFAHAANAQPSPADLIVLALQNQAPTEGVHTYLPTRTSQHGTGRLARHAQRKSAMRPRALGLCSVDALSRHSRKVSKCAEHKVLVAHSSATCRQQLASSSRCGAPRGEASENARSKYSTSSLGSRGDPDRAARACVAIEKLKN